MGSWNEFFKSQINQPYFQKLNHFLKCERENKKKTIFPPTDKIFRVFHECPVDKVNVVILGQDPYHQPGVACGLAFSTDDGSVPRSLKNIFTELSTDLGVEKPKTGDLTPWLKQGVFLMNTILTVEQGQPQSHINHGWEIFTSGALQYLSTNNPKIVYLLWGKFAEQMETNILQSGLILKAAHPSPYSAKQFFGCKHFSKTNEYLKSIGKKPINWVL